jgi:N-acetylmuramoyl-L-alanine amidase
MLELGSKNRPGRKRKGTVGIALHWPGPYPSSTPGSILAWWASETRYGSAHDIIGKDGELLTALPENEVGYHLGAHSYTPFKREMIGLKHPNNYFHGIETCCLNTEGLMTDATWRTAVARCKFLCAHYGLETSAIVTHEMIVGYVSHWGEYHCHQWFHDHDGELERFRREVGRV